jgi:nitroreductase
MNVFEAIASRRSTKQFDKAHSISDKVLKEILSAALLSPTAFNIQHWRFINVVDDELRESLREAAWGQPQVTDASALIILCGDINAWKKQPHRYWRDAPEDNRNRILDMMNQFYNGRETLQRDEVIRSCAIAAQSLMLAAQAKGYGTCPMDGFDFSKVAELIQLPEDHIITMMVAIGRGTQPPWPRSGQLAYDEVVIENQFA